MQKECKTRIFVLVAKKSDRLILGVYQCLEICGTEENKEARTRDAELGIVVARGRQHNTHFSARSILGRHVPEYDENVDDQKNAVYAHTRGEEKTH